jgi:hypothetical protein
MSSAGREQWSSSCGCWPWLSQIRSIAPSPAARVRPSWARPASKGVFNMPALEGLASESGSGQPELGPERPEALFDVFASTEPG